MIPSFRRFLVLPALLAALVPLAASCGVLDDPGFIVFSSGEPGARDIAIIRPNGDDLRVVIAGSKDEFSPVWDPGSQRIAFLTTRDGNAEVYIAPADGASVMRVTNTEVDESQVIWSPDGTRMAYTSPDELDRPHVYWLRLSDLLPTRLVFGTVGESDPAWSPSGTWIAFAQFDEDGVPVGLFLRNPEGVNRIQVSDSPDRTPVWSPDGSRLAFVSSRDGNEEIYVVNITDRGPDGQPVRLTDNPGRDYAPVWSPDSKRIAFLSDRSGNVDILTVKAGGGDLQVLTRNDVEELGADWGPDGRIVFSSEPAGKPDLFVTTLDGVQAQLTTGGSPATQPHW